MRIESRAIRRIGWAATTLASAAALTTLTAPAALANVGPITIADCAPSDNDPCPSVSPLVAGHQYKVTSPANQSMQLLPFLATAGTTVNFYDNGQCIASGPAPTGMGVAGFYWMDVTVYWVPTAGTHTIKVTQGTESTSATVNVTAAPAGSTPAQPPKQPGCGGGGSIGSGSASI
ncbi:hypothetical protein GPX89_09545 [Nocardia sp. ET3-3]|uniref:Ig-like domain repeat protein n=1 Tax=Nocardia terrae TaxID=2675851 RepID=A0A7K1UT20_9NOCA|nr:hypothetical protein [Nocardia terrae]MVU77490.1 hypothetical protein [Nocardia terrae]